MGLWPLPGFGHQILAQVFGGKLAVLEIAGQDAGYSLEVNEPKGILTGVDRQRVFAEHRDQASRVLEGFQVLSQKGEMPYIIRTRRQKRS